MPDDAPHLADLRRAAGVFSRFASADTAWLRFADVTRPAPDLSLASHRDLLLRFLNAWGCRIRYPRAGEPAPFGAALSAWWQSWQPALPQVSLPWLQDRDIDAVAAAYAALAAVPVSDGRPRRTLGPTALIAETGTGESGLPALIGRPAVPLAKILDEYLYLTYTMKPSADRRGTAVRSGHHTQSAR